MLPFQQFANGLKHVRNEINQELEELLVFSEVLARKNNTLEMDENGVFYSILSGSIEDMIAMMHKQLQKLERIKYQKDNQR